MQKNPNRKWNYLAPTKIRLFSEFWMFCRFIVQKLQNIVVMVNTSSGRGIPRFFLDTWVSINKARHLFSAADWRLEEGPKASVPQKVYSSEFQLQGSSSVNDLQFQYSSHDFFPRQLSRSEMLSTGLTTINSLLSIIWRDGYGHRCTEWSGASPSFLDLSLSIVTVQAWGLACWWGLSLTVWTLNSSSLTLD